VKYFFSKEHVITKTQIGQFVDLLDNFIANKKPTEHLLPNLQYGISYDHIKNQVGELVEQLIGPHEVPGCFLQRTKRPLHVHSDYSNNSNGKDSYYAILFPLRFDGPCSTVVFKEKGEKSHIEMDDPKTDYKYTDDQLSKVKHNKEFVLERLSYPETIDWHPGNVIVWDRRHFHCSDNFLTNETTYKDSLVLFTTRIQ